MGKTHVDEEFDCELRKIRKIIGIIVEFLEERIHNIRNGTGTEDGQDSIGPMLGKNENILSAVCKLGNLMLKLGGLGARAREEKESGPLEEVDLQLMRSYLETLLEEKSNS
ncbi:MAG: hypothetical protein LBU15_01155 [Rickettsiales bacterium]|jgi:hypothetical protein|nr:hypothetical protein [Rickettsiales bacterium]